MSQRHVKYLLIGGGVASASAAEAIRERDPQGSVLLVGQEIVRPYHRPPLSKGFLLGEVSRDALFAHEAGWYAGHQVELQSGRRVARLDGGRAVAFLDDGQEVSFDKALIATGGAPAVLEVAGAGLANVYSLRTLEDADRLRHAMEQALMEGRTHEKGRGRVVVVGGGLLGVELSATAALKGLGVTLVVKSAHPWSRFAGEALGQFMMRYMESRGVEVITDQRVEQFAGDGHVQRVALSDGRVIDCDFAIAAVGMTPHKEMVRGTRIMAERAILTDANCRTNVEGVYAAGDCAAIYDPLFGKHRLIDHREHAQLSGALAGANMAGDARAYDEVSVFYSEVFDLTMFAWGESKLVSRRLTRGVAQVDRPELVEIGLGEDGRVAQVVSIGTAKVPDELWRKLVRQRTSLDGWEEMAKDPSSDLTILLDR